MSIIALIPARSNSKGVKDKNIKRLSTRPLLTYSIMAALKTPSIDRVIVSTDSEKYRAIAKKWGAEVPFLRPTRFSTNKSTAEDFITHALDWFRDNEGAEPSLIVMILPTTPLRDPKIIEKAIHVFKMKRNATGLRSAHEMSETAYKMVEIKNGYFKCICSGSSEIDLINLPRQNYPKTYHPNGYVDIIKPSSFRKTGKLFGNNVVAYVTPFTVEIDTPEDFMYLQFFEKVNPHFTRKLFSMLP